MLNKLLWSLTPLTVGIELPLVQIQKLRCNPLFWRSLATRIYRQTARLFSVL